MGQEGVTAKKEAIQKLSFLEGKWKGKGWIILQGGQKNEFDQTENVQRKLDGTVLLIEGLGKNGEKTIHNAMAVVSYNPQDSSYQFRSYLANGREGDYKAKVLGEGHFQWFLETPRGMIRYDIIINEQKQWYEKGEFQMGENNWFHFFEMTLNKIE